MGGSGACWYERRGWCGTSKFYSHGGAGEVEVAAKVEVEVEVEELGSKNGTTVIGLGPLQFSGGGHSNGMTTTNTNPFLSTLKENRELQIQQSGVPHALAPGKRVPLRDGERLVFKGVVERGQRECFTHVVYELRMPLPVTTAGLSGPSRKTTPTSTTTNASTTTLTNSSRMHGQDRRDRDDTTNRREKNSNLSQTKQSKPRPRMKGGLRTGQPHIGHDFERRELKRQQQEKNEKKWGEVELVVGVSGGAGVARAAMLGVPARY